jgi:hypothetical protein
MFGLAQCLITAGGASYMPQQSMYRVFHLRRNPEQHEWNQMLLLPCDGVSQHCSRPQVARLLLPAPAQKLSRCEQVYSHAERVSILEHHLALKRLLLFAKDLARRILTGECPTTQHRWGRLYDDMYLVVCVFGIATGYELDDGEFGVRILVGFRISTTPRRSDRLWGSTQSSIQW